MEEDGEDLTPFWVQSNTNVRRTDRLRRGVAAVFFSSGLVVFLLLVTAVVFLVFVVPSTISFSASIFRPNSVKKSWDSLNIVLVLVAVVFGFLSRNRDDDRVESQTSPVKKDESQKSNPSTPNKWFGYSTNYEEKSNLSPSNQWHEYQDYQRIFEQKSSSLRRSSSSYPDLREFPSTSGDYQKRFLDDFYVDSSRSTDPWQLHHRRHRSSEQVDSLRPKTAAVDTLVAKSTDFPATLPSPTGDEEISKNVISEVRKERRFYKDYEILNPISADSESKFDEFEKRRSERKRERSSRRQSKDMEPITIYPPPPQKSSKSEHRRGGGGGAGRDFLNSLYNKKKKKQRQKSVDNLNHLLHEAETPQTFQIPPPPPPPPPPSVFHNIFSSKKHKRKTTITVTPPSPPPAPPRPVKMNSFDETSTSGGESPLNRIPPPPPPPPPFLKNPAWKFVVQGDYVRVNSNTSSRSGSPELDETDSDVTPSASESGDTAALHPSPLFCASPDVNTKAESFITNFRAKLKLEKNYSMNKRELGPSTLGPRPDSN